jgi:hypothetical protein
MIAVAAGPRMKPELPRLVKGVVIKGRVLKNLRKMALRCYTTNSSTKENDDGGAESLFL